MRLAPTAILFDWDNTLANGWAAIQAGLNAAFREFGLPEWTMEQVLANTRRSMAESFPQIFGEEWHRARWKLVGEMPTASCETLLRGKLGLGSKRL